MPDFSQPVALSFTFISIALIIATALIAVFAIKQTKKKL